MACCSFNWRSWVFMTALMVSEALIALISSILWGTGCTEKIIRSFVDPQNCTGVCLHNTHFSVQDCQLMAAVLYGVCAFFASVSVVGLLSGQVWLQVPNVLSCFLKIVGTIYICEFLLDVEQGTKLYNGNRGLMYICTVFNILVLLLNINQTKAEYDREQMERSGRTPAENRPLTNLLSPYFQNCNWCRCGDETVNSYEVNCEEINVPINKDLPDGERSIDENDAPGNAVRYPVEGLVSHVVVMEEENLSDIENLDGSVRSEGENLNNSKISRHSNCSPKTEESGKVKKPRYGSQSGESTNDQSQDGEYKD